MPARDHAKPVLEDFGAAFADPSIITPKAGRCCLRGTTDAPRDGEAATRVVPMVLAL
jgi:hypothetical protein